MKKIVLAAVVLMAVGCGRKFVQRELFYKHTFNSGLTVHFRDSSNFHFISGGNIIADTLSYH
jgi:hypothetical protein